MNNSYLKYLITEPVYVIDGEDHVPSIQEIDSTESSNKLKEPSPALYKEKLNVKGDRNSEVLIVNIEPNDEFISTDQEAFLKNILAAVKLDIAQVAIINISKIELPFIKVLEILTPKTILAFGAALPEELQAIDPYSISTYKNCKILKSDSLGEIALDKAKKKALWESLQQLFLK